MEKSRRRPNDGTSWNLQHSAETDLGKKTGATDPLSVKCRFVRRVRQWKDSLRWKDQQRAFRFFRLWATSFSQLSGRFGAYDTVILHDTLGVLAALWLAGWHRSRIIMDISETPNLCNRTTPLFARSWLPFHWLYEATAAWVGRGAFMLLLQSPDLKEVARLHFHREGAVWVHVRSARELPPCRKRENAGSKSNAKIMVAWPSDLSDATGASLAIQLLDAMSDKIKMVFIGAQISNQTQKYMERRYGDSVKFHARVKEYEYLNHLKECDIALVLFDLNLENTRLCLPNRFLDCMQVGVPVVSTPHPGVKRLLQAYPSQGVMTQTRHVEELRTAILSARELRAECLDGRRINQALEGVPSVELLRNLSAPIGGRIAVLAQRDVTDRPRFRQLVRMARQTGCAVDAFSRAKPRRWVIESESQ